MPTIEPTIKLEQGSWYLIHYRDKFIVGQHIKTRGDDEWYPSFFIHFPTTHMTMACKIEDIVAQMVTKEIPT